MDKKGQEKSEIIASLGSPGSPTSLGELCRGLAIAPGAEADSPANGEAASSLNHAIDAVAREMTALDAPAGMRVEVLARIEGGRRQGSALLPRWAMAASVAVIVLAVAATIWFARPWNQPDSVIARRNASSTLATGEVRPPPRQSGKLVSAGLVTGAPAATQPGGGAGHALRVAAAAHPDQNATAAPEMGPAALAQPEPIVIAALGPDAIHIPDIGIEPLGDLKPITIQDLPIGSGEPQSPSIHK